MYATLVMILVSNIFLGSENLSTWIDKTTPSYVDQLLILHYFKVYLISQGSNIGLMVIINYLRQLIWLFMDSLGHKILLYIPKLISQVK